VARSGRARKPVNSFGLRIVSIAMAIASPVQPFTLRMPPSG
jgi:hypothetical protein